MRLNKEDHKMMRDIFQLLDTTCHAMKWDITLPLGFLEKNQYIDLHSEETTNYLNKAVITISAVEEPFMKPDYKKTITISFGKRKLIQKKDKKIIVNFKYAPILLPIILNSIDSTMLTIETEKLSYITNIHDFRKKIHSNTM